MTWIKQYTEGRSAKDVKFNAAYEGNKAKLDGLRAAAKEGFDAIERGDYTELNSEEEIQLFMKGIHRKCPFTHEQNSCK